MRAGAGNTEGNVSVVASQIIKLQAVSLLRRPPAFSLPPHGVYFAVLRRFSFYANVSLAVLSFAFLGVSGGVLAGLLSCFFVADSASAAWVCRRGLLLSTV